MKFAFAVTGGTLAASSALLEDVTTMLSVSAISNSLKLAAHENSETTLNQVAKAQDPRKAAELLQEFAINTVEAGQGIDADTRKKLISIRDILTNETYIALEQAHRHDQDLLNKHAQAINECGYKHIMHLQQDIEGLEVKLVRDTEASMYACQGVPQRVELLQVPKYAQGVAGDEVEGTWRDAAVDEWGNYDPTKDPDGSYARKAVRSGPNEEQIAFGRWIAGEGGRPATRETGHRLWSNWTGVNDPKFDDPDFIDCSEAHAQMFEFCDALDEFIRGLPRPNCQPPIGTTAMEVPTCDDQPVGVDSDLFDWFTNMKENALFYQNTWRDLKKKCDDARKYYKEICLDECARRQRIFEQSFCSYRQGLHATCREYQGCHVLTEEQFLELLKETMYNADSRKIDWKAIHKIECYINVLISTASNAVRAKSLLNCEAGNLNTIETILTGFNETNYLSVIAPEINVSCWNMDVPQYIDWKECDMTSVKQYPCTEQWMDRYNGLTAPAECTECAPIPDAFQYHMTDQDGHKGAKLEDYGGGWHYVHELGRSATDIDDLTELTPGGYHLPTYVTGGLRWNEVLIQRVSQNWCDSWGAQSSYWAEDGGASMCIQSDNEHVYCMNNANGGHSWRQQPASQFTVNCGKDGQPACDCWPKNKENICWAYHRADAAGPTLQNVEAPRHIRILPMEEDGSVVKISFQGQEKSGKLTVGNYNSFMQDGEGCRAITAVRYRVYVRCMGCSTSDDGDFHVFDGAQFNGKMTIGHMKANARAEYTYEGWVRSPLVGKQRREIFGGSSTGLTLTNEGAVPCLHDVGSGYMKGGKKQSGYQLHVGGTDAYGAFCLEEDTWYFVAATKNNKGEVHIYVNGRDVTETGHNIVAFGESNLELTVGGGFVDGGQLFNLRIWSYARTQLELYSDAFATRFEDMQTDVNGLDHWWPLTHDLQDVMTGEMLAGPEVRYKPVWWSDLEVSGMRGNWKAGYGLPFGQGTCGGAGVFHQTCGAKDPAMGCVYVHKDRVEQCNYIGGNHIDDWGCYSDVSDSCSPKIQAGRLETENTYNDGDFVQTHSFESAFAKTPVVVATMGSKGPHSAHVQIWDVKRSGFKYAIMEPHGWDKPHIAETVYFVAAVPGESTLGDLKMEVGLIDSAHTVGAPFWTVGEAAEGTITNQWESIEFKSEFTEPPALLTGIQTMSNQDVDKEAVLRQPWLVPAVKGLEKGGFKLSMDRCEAKGGTVAVSEKIGYIAVTPGHGTCKKSSCYGEKFVFQHALTSGKNMGWDDRDSNLEFVSFPEHFDNNNIVAVASKSTRAGNNGGWMRILDVKKDQVSVVVDEDTSMDEERKHLSENVGLAAFSGSFVF